MAGGEQTGDKVQDKSRPDLKVTDRRHFTSDGERRGDLPEEREEPVSRSSREEPRGESSAGFEHRPLDEPAGVDFTMLINAFAQPA